MRWRVTKAEKCTKAVPDCSLFGRKGSHINSSQIVWRDRPKSRQSCQGQGGAQRKKIFFPPKLQCFCNFYDTIIDDSAHKIVKAKHWGFWIFFCCSSPASTSLCLPSINSFLLLQCNLASSCVQVIAQLLNTARAS